MKITLAQAVPLRGIISRRIQELLHERNSVSVVTIEKGDTYEKPVRSMELVTEELTQAREDLRKLDIVMTTANLSAFVKWDGEDICITEAIELSKQIRGEVTQVKAFGNRKKQEKETNWRSPESSNIVVALYEPETYRQLALKLERQVNKLSQDIEAKNHTVEIEYAGAIRYIEV
ncbi:MAG: hypothetical protein K0R18_244 [Bacillales bacterium]|jgi:hypothetical protein|nr:hypothetical protein [Bacillales bacterium]